MIDGKYFDANDILSYGAPISTVFGSREIGKSYGMMRRALARRRRNHEGMIWLRPFAEDAEKLAQAFGNGKWQELWTRYGYNKDDFRRTSGNRIVYREGDLWRPLIRYAGLSEWESLRDTDDPQEKFLFVDEFVVSSDRLKRYAGAPAQNLLDAIVTLRRGGKKSFPVLLAGNPERGIDWLLPALGVDDRRTPEKVRVYSVDRDIAEEYKIGRVAVLWTRNPRGQSVGGRVSGTAGVLPESLLMRRSGLERIYANIDLGFGLLSVWYGRDCMIVDTVKGDGWVLRSFPDGSRDTVVYTPAVKKNFVFLRDFYRAGRVRFANAEAYKRFQATAGKII